MQSQLWYHHRLLNSSALLMMMPPDVVLGRQQLGFPNPHHFDHWLWVGGCQKWCGTRLEPKWTQVWCLTPTHPTKQHSSVTYTLRVSSNTPCWSPSHIWNFKTMLLRCKVSCDIITGCWTPAHCWWWCPQMLYLGANNWVFQTHIILTTIIVGQPELSQLESLSSLSLESSHLRWWHFGHGLKSELLWRPRNVVAYRLPASCHPQSVFHLEGEFDKSMTALWDTLEMSLTTVQDSKLRSSSRTSAIPSRFSLTSSNCRVTSQNFLFIVQMFGISARCWGNTFWEFATRKLFPQTWWRRSSPSRSWL